MCVVFRRKLVAVGVHLGMKLFIAMGKEFGLFSKETLNQPKLTWDYIYMSLLFHICLKIIISVHQFVDK